MLVLGAVMLAAAGAGVGLHLVRSAERDVAASRRVTPELYSALIVHFDPARPGRGAIDYGTYPVADIPKGYAMILQAELNRTAARALPGIPSLAGVAGRWLLDHADENRNRVIGWGVPVGWDAFGDGSPNPPDAEYTISTAIAADALLDWLAQDPAAPKERILSTVGAAFLPYLSDEVLSPSGLFPYSLEPQDRRYDCFNPAAYLAGQMQRYSALVSDAAMRDRLRAYADRTVAALIRYKKIDPSGHWYWAYSVQEDNNPNDMAHAGYIIDGLGVYVRHGGRLAGELDLTAARRHLELFFDRRRTYVRGWPTNRTDIDRPARSYDIGMGLALAARHAEISTLVEPLSQLSFLYRLQDGRYTKYPYRPTASQMKPTAIDTMVIQEYQAYILRGLSYALFKPQS